MNNTYDNDNNLWNRLKAGEHGALEIIYNQEFGFLYNYGKKISKGNVEDAIQELFVELWEHRASLSHTDHIRPYLTISLKRKLIKSLKKSQKTELHDDDKDILGNSSIEINVKTDNPYSDLLARSIEELSPRQKEVIYLKYYGGMDYDEIAQIMDLNYQSARNLISRAMKTLTKYMTTICVYVISCIKLSTNL